MYKRDWQTKVYKFLEKVDIFIVDTLEFVESKPYFSSKSIKDLDAILLEIVQLKKNAEPNKHVKEDFLKLVTSTNLKKHVCNLKYEETSLLNEYLYQTANYFDIVSNNKKVNMKFNDDTKKAFRYFYEEIPSSKNFIKKYGECDINFKDQLKILIGESQTCPYCDIHELENPIKSIDHYLPQSKFPLLSLFSKNLIVACMPCNERVKLTKCFLPTLHPAIDNIEEYFFFDVEYKMKNYKIKINYNETLNDLEIEKIENYLRTFNIRERYTDNGCNKIRKLVTEIEDNVINLMKNLEPDSNSQFKTVDKVMKILENEIINQIRRTNEQKLINSFSKLKLDFLNKFIKDKDGIKESAEYICFSF